jgi:hypothetical protein
MGHNYWFSRTRISRGPVFGNKILEVDTCDLPHSHITVSINNDL